MSVISESYTLEGRVREIVDDISRIKARQQESQTFRDKKLFIKCIESYEGTVSDAIDRLGSTHNLSLSIQDEFAEVLWARGLKDWSTQIMKNTLNEVGKKFGEDHNWTTSIRRNLAGKLTNMGDHSFAEKLNRKTLNLLKIHVDEDRDQGRLGPLRGLARNLFHQKDYQEARKYYKQVLLLQIDLHKEWHPYACEARRDLAITCFELHEYEDARKYAQMNLDILKRSERSNHNLIDLNKRLERRCSEALQRKKNRSLSRSEKRGEQHVGDDREQQLYGQEQRLDIRNQGSTRVADLLVVPDTGRSRTKSDPGPSPDFREAALKSAASTGDIRSVQGPDGRFGELTGPLPPHPPHKNVEETTDFRACGTSRQEYSSSKIRPAIPDLPAIQRRSTGDDEDVNGTGSQFIEYFSQADDSATNASDLTTAQIIQSVNSRHPDSLIDSSRFIKCDLGSTSGTRARSHHNSGVESQGNSEAGETTQPPIQVDKPQRSPTPISSSEPLQALQKFRQATVQGARHLYSHVLQGSTRGTNTVLKQPMPGESFTNNPSSLSPATVPNPPINRKGQFLQTPKPPRTLSPSSSHAELPRPDMESSIFDAKEYEHAEGAIVNEADNFFTHPRRLPNTQALLNQARKDDGFDQVKVCVIDTGLDGGHPYLYPETRSYSYGRNWGKRIKGYVSWDDEGKMEEEPEWEKWRAFGPEEQGGYEDDSGHGTHCAGLILQVAPNAHLYVARVLKGRGPIDPKIVAEAIRHATEKGGWEVDIISMSFGFTNDQIVIEDAIKEASFKRVIMFAAAANHGSNEPDIAFPARMSEVICVKSARGSGPSSDFNPTNTAQAGGLNLTALGEGVRSIWRATNNDLGDPVIEKRMNGTSVATPIAAAVAALLLEFSRQPDEGKYKYLKMNRERLKGNNGILRVFEKGMTSHQKDGTRYLAPWLLLKADSHVSGSHKGASARERAASHLHECFNDE